MRKAGIRVFRIIGWVVLGIISFVLLLTLVFYLGRDYFVNRALGYVNEQQPGEVQMDKVYLIPFLNFPDITLHLQEVKYYEEAGKQDTSRMEPIVSLEDIAVTLDLVPLIKGGVRISEARLKDGFVHMEIYEDSISNLERALGIRFGESPKKDADPNKSGTAIDLDKLELINVRGRLDDYVRDEFVDAEILQLESSFSYHPGSIRSSIEVDVYINSVKYQTINDQIDKLIQLDGSISLDPDKQRLEVEPSRLSVSGLDFETWGHLQFGSSSRADLAFTAVNEGLELLNFIFLGILDLEEIEQIGSGSIHLNGTVQGPLGSGSLPVIRVNGEAEDLGFRVKTVGRDVTGISKVGRYDNSRRSSGQGQQGSDAQSVVANTQRRAQGAMGRPDGLPFPRPWPSEFFSATPGFAPGGDRSSDTRFFSFPGFRRTERPSGGTAPVRKGVRPG